MWSADIRLLAEFVTSYCPNRNSRTAYARSIAEFVYWRDERQLGRVIETCPSEVAGWLQSLGESYSVATVRLRLAALRGFLDWLVLNQAIAINPARSVRGPKERLTKGKTPSLSSQEARAMLQHVSIDTLIGRRDKAVIAVMLYTFARIGAVLALRRTDVYQQGRRTWVRLHEKGGKVADIPCHHELDEILSWYLNSHPFAPHDYIFQSVGRNKSLTGLPVHPANFYQRVKRYARELGLSDKISNHSFRATGITAFLSNNGSLEMAAKIANHSSTRTTQLYDRRCDEVVIGEVERIRFE
ncbi:MAG: tyrosine-type recombinase/integrase [Pelagibacterium sp.]|uniref:tyrosine-type recombinase/integrase n=1 Tax=Pelagibacterium sp. TaxID=1967288 RepID=UPI0032F01299